MYICGLMNDNTFCNVELNKCMLNPLMHFDTNSSLSLTEVL